MKPKRSTIQWIGTAIILGIIFGLGGWYFFISRQTSSIEDADSARGVVGRIPDIGGVIGSTASNFRSFIGFGAQPVGTTSVVGQGGILVNGTLIEGSGGGFGTSATSTVTATSTLQIPELPQTPGLWQLSRTPAAGITLHGSTSTEVLFADRATGHIYRGDTFTGDIRRISNTLIPKTYTALFTQKQALLQHLLEPETLGVFSGALPTTSASTTLEGAYLEEGILAIATHPELEEIVYLASDAGGVVALLTEPDGTNPRRIWSSTLQGWNVSIPSPNTVLFVQHASAGVAGSAYSVDLDTLEPTLIYRGTGLSVAPSPNQERLIVSTSHVDSLNTVISEGLYATTTPLSIRTLAEKCVWNPVRSEIVYCAVPSTTPRGSYPDTWYRGEVHTSDVWWRVNTTNYASERLFDPAEYSISLDVSAPSINTQGTHISFIDVRTQTPWVLRIADYE